MPAAHERISAFSTLEQQRKQNACLHDWQPRRRVLLGAILAFARCRRCSTWWGAPEGWRIGPSGWLEPGA